MAEPQETVPVRPAWSVGALLLATGDALAARFGSVTVRGELTGFSRAASGHCYFCLKDADGAPALLRCAMFRRAALLVDFAPADGQQVEVRGRLAVYEARGELQLVAESLQRLGAGSLYEEFVRRRARLQALGLFDSARKRPLPPWPAALGIVTSPEAAALRDVVATLARRAPHVRVVLYPAPVQGAQAPAALAAALREAGERREVAALLLVRGGGSLEDLWAFNDERVVHAVASSPLPVVCGVGHETDVTLADMAADVRAPTPTAAAEIAAPERGAAVEAVRARANALARAVERRLQQQAQTLDTLVLRLGGPGRALLAQTQRLDDRAGRLQRALAQRRTALADQQARLHQRLQRALSVELQRLRQGLEAAAQRLDAHDPQRVLQRGYAWVEGADGRPLVTVRGLAPGQEVRAVWADGSARARVTWVDGPDAAAQPPAA